MSFTLNVTPDNFAFCVSTFSITKLYFPVFSSSSLFGIVTVTTFPFTFSVTFTLVPSFNVTSFVVISSFSLNDALSSLYSSPSNFLLTYTANSSFNVIYSDAAFTSDILYVSTVFTVSAVISLFSITVTLPSSPVAFVCVSFTLNVTPDSLLLFVSVFSISKLYFPFIISFGIVI